MPQQLLVGEQLLEMFGEELLLQGQLDPGPHQSHLRQTFTHPLDEPEEQSAAREAHCVNIALNTVRLSKTHRPIGAEGTISSYRYIGIYCYYY